MRKVFIRIVIALFSASLFSQSFYRYQGNVVDLKVDSTLFVIQTDEQFAERQNSYLEKQLSLGEIRSFKKIANNRFLVARDVPHLGEYGYYSYAYRNSKNDMVIILPRIGVMFRQAGIQLQEVLESFKGKLIKESGENQYFISVVSD